MEKDKIKTEEEIVKIVEELKAKGKKISAFSGSFDILHAGHIKAIQEVKSQGDYSIILLNSDSSIKGYKDPLRPINTEENRGLILSELESVDYIVIFNDLTPNRILERIKPDIYCNGLDYGKDCIEKEVVEKNGGKIHILKWENGLSTSDLINKILDIYKVNNK